MQQFKGDTMTHPRSPARITWRLLTLLLVAFGLVAGVTVVAQSGRGTLIGTVTDTTGSVVSGASLNLIESNTGNAYVGTSSSEGLFTFPELPPGTYTLQVNAAGFESFKQVGIIVQVASTSTVSAMLK